VGQNTGPFLKLVTPTYYDVERDKNVQRFIWGKTGGLNIANFAPVLTLK